MPPSEYHYRSHCLSSSSSFITLVHIILLSLFLFVLLFHSFIYSFVYSFFVLSVCSSLSARPWSWRHHVPSKCCELLNQQHSFTSQKSWVFKNTAVKSSNLKEHKTVWSCLASFMLRFYPTCDLRFSWPWIVRLLCSLVDSYQCSLEIWYLHLLCEGYRWYLEAAGLSEMSVTVDNHLPLYTTRLPFDFVFSAVIPT